jgi:hypothetical protein
VTTDLILIIPLGSALIIGLYDFLRFDLRGQFPKSRNETVKELLRKRR